MLSNGTALFAAGLMIPFFGQDKGYGFVESR